MKTQLTHRSTVQQWECDHMGHMNVRHYMAKFDDAAWSFFSMIGITNSYFKEQNAGVAAVDHHVTYKKELMPGDSVVIHTELAVLEGKKFKMIHSMSNSVSGELVATCELFGVHLDREKRCASDFPQDIIDGAKTALTPTDKMGL